MSNKIQLFLILFLFLTSGYSQKYNAVDSVVLKYPKHFDTPKELVSQIQKDFSSEYDKSRAIYTWMALNINYDIKSWLNPKPKKAFSYKTELEKDLKIQEIKNEIIKNVFKNQIAVCEGYSLLFNHLATLAGLKSEVILGMSKTIPGDIGQKKQHADHAWNSVLIDGTWRLIDVTWGAGSIVNRQNLWVKEFKSIYFDCPSKVFFAKHLPVSGVWQTQILDKEDFQNSPLFYEPFFAEGYEILEPKSGIINAVEGQKITFKIKNLSQYDTLIYRGQSEVSTKINSKNEQDNSLEFVVVYHKIEGRFMTFYVNSKAVVVFKIKPNS